MNTVKSNSIKNLNGHIEIRIEADESHKNPILYVKARKEENCSLSFSPYSFNNNKVIFRIPASSLSYTNIYYDAYLEYINRDGDLVQERIKNSSRRKRLALNLLNLKHQRVQHSEHEYLVTEYFAVGGYLAFQVRKTDEYDNYKYKLKEFLACLLAPLMYWRYKDSKLIYEKFSNYARDNSFYYFAYTQKNDKHNKLFYIITKNSPDIKNLEPYKKNVVYFMSIKHILLILISKYFIASESKGHAYAWRHNQSIPRYFLNRKPFVFLQHGVLGLKKVDRTFFANNRLNHADLFITSSEIEKKIVLDFLGYKEQDVAVTGLARWDNFKGLSKEKKIFVMPTWRVQLDLLSDEEFLRSEFYLAYSKLLHSTKIKQILHDNSYQLHFMLHPKFVRFEKYFMSDDENIKIIHQSEEPIDQELKTSELLITDYSSIMWDALYYDCPTLLFQFDQDDYLQRQGSYLDFQADLKDIIIKNPQILLKKIVAFMQNKETVNLSSLKQKYFSYTDQENSKRIYDSIGQWESSYQFKPLYKKHS
ncbi:CDP-glycerol glycerophosphotransferase family protein [Lactiplantibacillus pentosus]|uniref:CDP-glycerol glycerophosphotransferase family protein n=1 Tax=Lactiplantibacillus pentosus TaxID=1589 RepID=UPI0019317080|nr:CDP-glycerol glycerophosphotransferase family protein [Lactiplantibacillus pentosus]